MKSDFRVLMTGGGTGGHIYPLLAVNSELQILAAGEGINLRVRYLGSSGPYRGLLLENGIEVRGITGSKLRRYFSLMNFIDGLKFLIALFQSLWKVFWFMPDVLFSKGGAGALSVVLIAKFYRIPIIVHESDSIPGLTNIISARYARVIATAFPSAVDYFQGAKGEVIAVGNPVRRRLFDDDLPQIKAKTFLGFDPNLPLIFILGGSQGAVRINDFILDNLLDLLKITQIFHQTGWGDYNRVVGELTVVSRDFSEDLKRRYKAVDYLEKDLKIVSAAADLVISRAGSGAIFELAAFGKPAILIPLPEWVANAHQEQNAIEYSSTGAAIVIEEANLLPHLFLREVQALLNDLHKLAAMSQAAIAFSKKDAALKLAEVILRMR